ncbi:MAG: hypothetical protein Q9M20_01380 [Mariprofundaceae bacterium]|nr:hypothetical protein [Mariprofundaceae bacterium]
MTGKTDSTGKLHSIFAIIEHQSRACLSLSALADKASIALVRLLSIGLRVLGLIEYRVRKKLYEIKDTLRGIYKGNPKRQTKRPTTEMMLKSFEGITLTELSVGKQKHQILSPLTGVQEKILSLAGISFEIYGMLTGSFFELPPKMRER